MEQPDRLSKGSERKGGRRMGGCPSLPRIVCRRALRHRMGRAWTACGAASRDVERRSTAMNKPGVALALIVGVLAATVSTASAGHLVAAAAYGDAIGDAGDAPDVARVTIGRVRGGLAVDVKL